MIEIVFRNIESASGTFNRLMNFYRSQKRTNEGIKRKRNVITIDNDYISRHFRHLVNAAEKCGAPYRIERLESVVG